MSQSQTEQLIERRLDLLQARIGLFGVEKFVQLRHRRARIPLTFHVASLKALGAIITG